MDVASQLARFGARERTAVVSREQTAGRGRGGRSWQAAAGSAVFATLILRPPVAADRLSTLPLIAGVAVAEVIERIAGCGVLLKWPNDVLLEVDDAATKVAGILVTSSLRGDGVDHVLVGVGINVLGGAQDLPSGATSIQAATESHRDPGRGLPMLAGMLRPSRTPPMSRLMAGRLCPGGWLAPRCSERSSASRTRVAHSRERSSGSTRMVVC